MKQKIFKTKLYIVVTVLLFAFINLNTVSVKADSNVSAVSLKTGIEKLIVRKEDLTKKYDRAKFKHWVKSTKYPQCNVRYEILIDEGDRTKVSKNCYVTGTWVSYYDRTRFTDPRLLDIDHMVPLHEAWKSGASRWSDAKRQKYANDTTNPYTLVAVSRSSNRSKSDKDPSDWLPKFNKCRYIAEWVSVKIHWKLTIDKKEKQALKKQSRNCTKSSVKIYK